MKFTKLYLHGFKSFVDKTTVDFPSGITAIVGPNGSGKSNIMDAVRWVFGEQNAKELRGADMDDVVFNGSQKRKPAGFAEVGLTLSDISEEVAAKYGTFSEITITRKFYKTGEREYYINNRKCRLKDIKDIFMDTGLGARSISIIEQGKVDKIINATPEELRFFLEETAGVTKFKDKKREAEKRLAQTRDNLNRVNDIINEIVGRMESLSSQVSTLKLSEELQSKKRALEKKFFASSYALKLREQTEKEKLVEEIKLEKDKKLAAYSELVKKELALNKEYSSLEETNRGLQERRLEKAKQNAKIEGDIATFHSKIEGAASQKVQITQDIDAQTKIFEKCEENKEILSDKKEALERDLEEINDKIAILEDTIDDIRLQKESVEEDFNECDKKYLEFADKINGKNSLIIRNEADIENQKRQIEKAQKELAEISLELEKTTANKANLQLELTKAEKTFKEKKETFDKNAAELKNVTETLDSLKITRSELLATEKSTKNNLEFLEAQILNAANSEQMNEVKKFNPTLLIDRLKGVEKTKLVEVGDVFLFQTSDRADVLETLSRLDISIKFAFEADFDQIVKTLDEIILNEAHPAIYSRLGIYHKIGKDDKGLKIISIKERINEESAKLAEISDKLRDLQKEYEYAENLSKDLKRNLESDERELKEAESFQTQIKNGLENACAEFERNNKRIATIEKEIAIFQSTYADCYETLSNLKKDVASLKERQAETELERDALEEKMDNINFMLDEKKDDQQELKIELSAASERLSSINKEVESNDREYSNSASNLKKLKERLRNLVEVDSADWNASILKLQEEQTQVHKELLSIEEELKNSQIAIEELKKDIEDVKLAANRSNEEVIAVDERLRELEKNLASAEAYTETISAQYFEKFGQSLEANYREFIDEEFDARKIKEEISRIDNEIEALGAINLNAINDYTEAEKRYNFLTTQRNDLEGSITDINAFIYETDDTTVKMFQETFDAVKHKFVEVFQILFGNGEAELRLTEPDNMLNTGVEIYIQPPGKKLQHMGLLSGGEKALTAMTLLFALFLQKPTPFCFLDEVDAPLDDANVARYTQMVKALADKTQFILITHNHNTMSSADSLYGVTMQEYGVSTILSVKLEQAIKAGR